MSGRKLVEAGLREGRPVVLVGHAVVLEAGTLADAEMAASLLSMSIAAGVQTVTTIEGVRLAAGVSRVSREASDAA